MTETIVTAQSLGRDTTHSHDHQHADTKHSHDHQHAGARHSHDHRHAGTKHSHDHQHAGDKDSHDHQHADGKDSHDDNPHDHQHNDIVKLSALHSAKKPHRAQRFTFYYSIAKGDVKFTPINDDKGHHQMRAKEFKLFYKEENDKLSVPIGTLKFIETVTFGKEKKIESFLTNAHMDFFNIPSDVPIGEGLGVTFKAVGQNDIKLSSGQPGVSQIDSLEEAIHKKRHGRVTSSPKDFKHPKLGVDATVTISTFPGKDHKQVVVHLHH